MIILAIDTSCDETSVSVLKDDVVVVQEVSSQIKDQSKWGGVVPMLARRKHFERMELVLVRALLRAGRKLDWPVELNVKLKSVLRQLRLELSASQSAGDLPIKTIGGSYLDHSLAALPRQFTLKHLQNCPNPGIDIIAVTVGPGLAVALEVGVAAAKGLATAWSIPATPINHMEGHFWSGFLRNSKGTAQSPVVLNYDPRIFAQQQENQAEEEQTQISPYPILGLLVSGGHTEMVFSPRYGMQQIVGQTVDDAAGEAFDKFSVMLNIGYPGGPVIEQLAEPVYRDKTALQNARKLYPLPIPMQSSGDLNFSFSGLKTAALYLKEGKEKTSALKVSAVRQFAASFQYSVTFSLRNKLRKAVAEFRPSLLMAGGGVIANKEIRKMIRNVGKEFSIPTLLPDARYLGDNASMIGMVGYLNALAKRNILNTTDISKLDRNPSLKITDSFSF
jgi:N6-L-threonylcarbamoyladenine synthase